MKSSNSGLKVFDQILWLAPAAELADQVDFLSNINKHDFFFQPFELERVQVEAEVKYAF